MADKKVTMKTARLYRRAVFIITFFLLILRRKLQMRNSLDLFVGKSFQFHLIGLNQY